MMTGQGAATLGDVFVPAMPARTKKWRLTDYLPTIFLLVLLTPYRIEAGPISLSLDRIFLLVTFIPTVILYLSGRAGRFLVADFLVLAHSLWTGLAFFNAHGVGGVEPAGIYMVETVGAYLIARCYIRSYEQFKHVVKVLFFCVAFLLPFMLYETLTGHHILVDLFGLLGPVLIPEPTEPRLGLFRASGAFAHPIIMGTFCASALCLSYYVFYRHSTQAMVIIRGAVVSIATLCSMSTAPLLALTLQYLMLAWDRAGKFVRGRWWILFWAAVALYVLIDLVSNRTPVQVMVSYLTFNVQSGYWRIHIWNYGSAEVLRNPLLGIGLNDWIRPPWMYSNSIDNFWLAISMKAGLPAFVFMAGAWLALGVSYARLNLTDPDLIACRRAWMITIVMLFLVGCTVHFWAAIVYHVMFLLGSLSWLLDEKNRRTREQPAAASGASAPAPQRRMPGVIPFN